MTFSGNLTVRWGQKAAHGPIFRHKTLSAIASQGVVNFDRVKLGPTGRGYAVQASGGGLNSRPSSLSTRNPPWRSCGPQRSEFVRSPSKPSAGHHPVAHAIRAHPR